MLKYKILSVMMVIGMCAIFLFILLRSQNTDSLLEYKWVIGIGTLIGIVGIIISVVVLHYDNRKRGRE